MIEVNNLVKRYGDHTAVDHLSFKIEKGKIYGFLGPNGAGKSTTMNMITGYIASTEGTVMENTTHESQYANAEISCTADEQLCRDAEFNLLMQAFLERGASFCSLFTGAENHAQKIYLRAGLRVTSRWAVLSQRLGEGEGCRQVYF